MRVDFVGPLLLTAGALLTVVGLVFCGSELPVGILMVASGASLAALGSRCFQS